MGEKKKVNTECRSSKEKTETVSASARQVQLSPVVTSISAPPLHSAVCSIIRIYSSDPDHLEGDKPEQVCLKKYPAHNFSREKNAACLVHGLTTDPLFSIYEAAP